ncbi:uncharacterized protein [Venturia canescens]|uniref:uncharacterized protein n=1 Tax=Venturia canescens TaxID=32260 RepID=UPI001C9BD384|nr:uncharacterized protein LOC122409675 [Venturia canescens]
MILPVILFLLLPIYALCLFHWNVRLSRKGKLVDKIPGPRAIPLFGNILSFMGPLEEVRQKLRRLNEEYYPIFKLWGVNLAMINIRHPDDAEILLSSTKHIEKGLLYKFMHPWFGTGLLTSKGEKWRSRRRILTPAFHFNVLQQFVEIFVEQGEKMVDFLKSDKENVQDLSKFLTKFTLNTICETAMGTALQDSDITQEGFRNAVYDMGTLIIHRILRPWLQWNWMFRLSSSGRRQAKALKVLHGFSTKIIEDRKKYHELLTGEKFLTGMAPHEETNARDDDPYSPKKKRLAMLDLLIAARKEGAAIDDAGIREEVDTFIFEGHDTTAVGMTFALLLLAQHKDIQESARAEVKKVVYENGGKMGMAEIQKLSYLERCLKESLRLYPSVPFISRTIREDLQLKTHVVPAGSLLSLHIFDMHRDPNFWSDPLVYDPDRFLPENIQGRHPYSYVPFSAGSRNCIGQRFAMLELKALVGHLLYNFYLEPIEIAADVRLLPDLVLRPAHPVRVKFIPIEKHRLLTTMNNSESRMLEFQRSRENFLGKNKSPNYEEIITKMGINYGKQFCLMNLRLHFLHSHLDAFPENLDTYNEEQGERSHQDLKEMERRSQGHWDINTMADFCWTLKREMPRKGIKRKRNPLNRSFKEKKTPENAMILWALFVIVLVLVLLHLLIHLSRAGRLINQIDGPPSLPVIGSLLYLLGSPDNLLKTLHRYSDDFYPIFRLWIVHWPVVFIRHPDDAEVLLSSSVHIEKSLFYDFLRPWLNNGLLTSTGKKWRNRRKILTPAFHFNMLRGFVDMFAETSERMIISLKNEGGPSVQNLVSLITQHTLNVICESAMGTILQDNDPLQKEYRSNVKEIGSFLYYRSTRPWLKNNWIFSLTEKGRKHKKCIEILHHFTSLIIEERKKYHRETGKQYLANDLSGTEMVMDATEISSNTEVEKQRLAMLDLLISLQEAHQGIDDAGIQEEVDTFIFEGHDTTAMSMCFAILLLAEHKQIQARARAEIDALFEEYNGRLGMDALANMPYLERCIKESLRLFPAVPTISRRISSSLQLKKRLIPSGTIVNCDLYKLHRDPHFWPEPLVYDPDRFLPELTRNRHPFAYIPFSGGPRNCIGQKFAMLELKTSISYLLHSYYFEPVVECRKLTMLPDLVLKSETPLYVKLVPIRQ